MVLGIQICRDPPDSGDPFFPGQDLPDLPFHFEAVTQL